MKTKRQRKMKSINVRVLAHVAGNSLVICDMYVVYMKLAVTKSLQPSDIKQARNIGRIVLY